MPRGKIGIAFRSTIIPPSQIVKFAKVVDQSAFTHIFVNEISPLLDCLDVCSAALGVTKGITVGSGVIRLLEHDENLLLRRLQTLQEFSNNRFALGVGTGSVTQNVEQTIELLLTRLKSLKSKFALGQFPSSFIATLKTGIVRKVAGHSDGILLNFCLPEYARKVLDEYRKAAGKAEFACYLKVFFSESELKAKQLFVEEFEKYSKIPTYRKMFEAEGIIDEIQTARQGLVSGKHLPYPLLRVSLVNPLNDELKDYISTFRDAGITLPCVYPYFASEDSFDFRMEKIRSIISAED